MAHRKFLIRYSNGFKQHVSWQELALHSSLEQIGPHEYLSKASLQATIEQADGRHYLPGVFIFVLKGKKKRELLETPCGLVGRLTDAPMR